MTKYTKTIRTGKFAEKGKDYKDKDLITILNEGAKLEGTFGVQDIFKVRVVHGDELSFRFNKTSINNMIDAYGDDSKDWVNKEVRVWLILQNVQGKMVKVPYVSHPDADIDDDGNFVLPEGTGTPKKVGKRKNEVVDDEIIEDEVGTEDDIEA
jgi:hypothetical protein